MMVRVGLGVFGLLTLGTLVLTLISDRGLLEVRRKGAETPVVLAYTLIAYDQRFEVGQTLAEALRPVVLNHPHCSRFCVLGGTSCSNG